ncbi:MAG: group II intron reverse transcriptase/maturase, partial [Oscillospiraceae bacterium]|nr:group II intron reverse transcriptase/maturase [Oscillospiraceae bacterium]
MATEQQDIRTLSEKHARLETLINHVNYETLLAEHRRQSRNKAVGVDKVTKEGYEANLEENLKDLESRMKKFSYRPQPVRRVEIPKANGKTRPLGIPSYEDKLVQGVMADILNDVYEPRFLDCSYGFRPGRKAHDAIKKVNDLIMFGKVNYILDCDIKGFFDNVDHEWMMKFLEHDIADKNFLRYIVRFLKAGIMVEDRYEDSSVGTPQGGLISPVLANVYLHYVLDLWFEKAVKPQMKGEAYLVRYADDFIMLFQYENEAIAVYEALKIRLAKF